MSAWIASPDVARRYEELSARSLPQDAADALDAIRRMSEENRADTPMERSTAGRYPSPPWLVALVRLLRGAEWGTSDAEVSSRWVLPVYDGDRPAGLTDGDIAYLSTGPARAYTMHSTLWDALHARGVRMPISDRDLKQVIVRATHRALHCALAGIATTGGLIEGCQWCAEGVR